MWATWRSRSVGSRVTPRASAMSWVCAQVSMIRAVSDDAALMAGPNPGQPRSGVKIFERVQTVGRGGAEPVEQLRTAAVAEPDGDRVGVDAAAGFGLGEVGLELLGTERGPDRDLVAGR